MTLAQIHAGESIPQRSSAALPPSPRLRRTCKPSGSVTRIIHERPTRLGAFASKTELRRPEKRGSGLPRVQRGAQPLAPQRANNARWGPRRLRPARPVVGLRRVFRVIETACSDGFRHERAESLKAFMNNPG